MSEAQAKAKLLFDVSQWEILERTADIIAGPFTDPLAQSTIRKLYYESLCSAFAAGRFSGVCATRDVVNEIISQYSQSVSTPEEQP